MRIKLLEHIHEVLKEEVEVNKGAYERICEVLLQAQANKQDNISYLEEQKMSAWKKWNTSRHYLEDFEDEEF